MSHFQSYVAIVKVSYNFKDMSHFQKFCQKWDFFWIFFNTLLGKSAEKGLWDYFEHATFPICWVTFFDVSILEFLSKLYEKIKGGESTNSNCIVSRILCRAGLIKLGSNGNRDGNLGKSIKKVICGEEEITGKNIAFGIQCLLFSCLQLHAPKELHKNVMLHFWRLEKCGGVVLAKE